MRFPNGLYIMYYQPNNNQLISIGGGQGQGLFIRCTVCFLVATFD